MVGSGELELNQTASAWISSQSRARDKPQNPFRRTRRPRGGGDWPIKWALGTQGRVYRDVKAHSNYA